MSTSHAQSSNPIPFRHQIGKSAPEGNLFKIKGDFTMIGNSNLTLLNFSDTSINSFAKTIYIDIDNDLKTFNSSSATLVFSEENNADPNCSEIRYAGIYWSGRTVNGTEVSFDVTKNVIPGEIQNLINEKVKIGETEHHQNEHLNVSIFRFYYENEQFRTNFSINDNNSQFYIDFVFDKGETVQYTLNGNDFEDVENLEITKKDGLIIATFNPIDLKIDELTFSFVQLTIKENYDETGFPDDDTLIHAIVNGNYTPLLPHTNNYDKRKIKLKGPNASDYTEVFTDGNSILFPSEDFAEIFVGYSDITEYVKQHGIGDYTVADIALLEDFSDNVGYFGSWGMIVIYQNSKMNWRDITIFDGYSFVESKDLEEHTVEIAINGFGTVNSGPVSLKLGLMAAEGDQSIEGDFFEMMDQKGDWVRLTHPNNTSDNFFNSTIYTPVYNASNQLIPTPRFPDLKNNLGADIVQWEIDNPDNKLITNKQASTKFRAGTRQDLFTIYSFAFSVLSYVPELQVLNQVHAINGMPAGSEPTVEPGQEITYTAEIRNLGSEEIKKTKITIPLPYTASFVSASTSPSNYGNVFFDPNISQNGAIVWDIGDLPLKENIQEIIATLIYTVKATEDCSVLTLASCETNVRMEGFVSGEGKISENVFQNLPFVYELLKGACEGEEINTPIDIPIVNRAEFVTKNCSGFSDQTGLINTVLPTFCHRDKPVDLADFIFPSTPENNVYFFTQETGGTSLKNYLVNTYTVGIETIWVAQGPDGECTSPRMPVEIEIIEKSPLPDTINNIFCLNSEEAYFQINQQDNYTINYYLDNSPHSSPVKTIPEIDRQKSGSYYVWVSQSKEGECESDRVKVETIIYDCSHTANIYIEIEPENRYYSYEGQIATFTITVSNVGEILLTNITVPEHLTTLSWKIPALAPNESISFTYTYAITADDLNNGYVIASASANGTSFLGNVFSYNHTSIFTIPEYLKDYKVTTIDAKCGQNQSNLGFLIIKFSQEDVQGFIELLEDGESVFNIGFEATDELSIEFKPGAYQIILRTLYDLEITDPDIYIIEGPSSVEFSLQEDNVYACNSYELSPISQGNILYEVFDSNGNKILPTENEKYLLNVTGTYKIIGKDPEGIKCSLERMINVEIPRLETVSLSIGSFCQNDYSASIELQELDPSYQINWLSKTDHGWNSLSYLDNETRIDLTESGAYAVTITNSNGCIVSRNEFEVTRTQNLPPNLYSFYTICPTKPGSQSITTSNRYKDHIWYQSDIEISQETELRPTESGRYTLISTDLTGCNFSIDFDVEIKCEPTLIYSNAIRLGVENQGLKIITDNLIESVSVQVFNRWGETIYVCRDLYPMNSQSSSCFWDGTIHGKEAPIGSYSLLIEYTVKGEDKKYSIRDMILILK